jgi:RNA polymerase-binding protein DksA
MARSTVKKVAGVTTPAKKSSAAKSASKANTEKTSSEKTSAKKSSAKKTPAKKSTKKTSDGGARKSAVKKAAASTTARKAPVTKMAPQKKTAEKLAVKADEKPWTAKELGEVRDELHAERERLRSELNLAETELAGLMRDAGDGAGNDQADVGSTTFERDHEMSLANNARMLLAQTEHALERIEDGSYGVCESCGQPIGKMRLMAFPRATLCLSCKQRQERR